MAPICTIHSVGAPRGPKRYYRRITVHGGLRARPQGSVSSTQGVMDRRAGIAPDLRKPVEEYLQDLKEKLGAAAHYAWEHTDKQQTGYASRCKTRPSKKGTKS